MRAWLPSAPEDVTALIGVSDWTAIGASRALNEAGRSVPRDISIVGLTASTSRTTSCLP